MDLINRAYIEVMTDGRRVGPRLHVPDPHLQHHPGLRLAQPERRPAVRDDRPLRAAVLPELPQLRAEPGRRPLDVLPPAAGPARAAQARQRPVRFGGADGVARRRHGQLRASRLPARGRRGRPARRRSTGCWTWRATSLELKRTVIQRYIDDGLFPYTRRYLGTLDNHFSTIGVNGLNEMVRNFTGDRYDITDHRGARAGRSALLDHVRARMVELQEATGHLYNLEATPAEGTTYRFAKEDRGAVPGHPAGRHGRPPVLHQLLAAAGRLHRRPVRGARAAGRAADEVHRRHGPAPVHGRAPVDARRVPRRWSAAR